TRVGRSNQAGLLSTVERERVRRFFVPPELTFECVAQMFRLCTERSRAPSIAERLSHLRASLPRIEHVRLDFAQRDGALGERPVRMKNCIRGVLPALVNQSLTRLTRVLHEAIAVAIAKLVNPRQRSVDVRPHPFEESPVAGTIKVRACKDDEERRCVYAAVVPA